jgi:hypothetical protein
VKPTDRSILKHVRQASTEEILELYRLRQPHQITTPEAAMDDRWLALAVLGELLRRGEINRLMEK